jgi:PAS domain S-box-containing protein
MHGSLERLVMMWSEDMEQRCHVLHLRDQREECDIAEQLINQTNNTYTVTNVYTSSALLDALLMGESDIILIHDSILGIDYCVLLSLIQHSNPTIPIIFILSDMSQPLLTEYFKHGLSDYLPNTKLCQLGQLLKRVWQHSCSQQLQRSAYSTILRVERRFAEVFPSYSTLFAIISADTGEVLAANHNFSQIIHPSHKQPLIGSTIEQLALYIPEHTTMLNLSKLRQLVSGYTYTIAYETALSTIQLTVSAEAITVDSRDCYLLITSELLLQQLQAQERPMFITRLSDGRYVEANTAWLQLCGYDRDEVLVQGRSIVKLWAKPAHRSRLLHHYEHMGTDPQFEYVLRRKSGELIIGLMTVELTDWQGQPCALMHDLPMHYDRTFDQELELMKLTTNLCFDI